MNRDPDTKIERTTGNVFAALGLPDAEEMALKSGRLTAIRAHLLENDLSDSRAMELLAATAEEINVLRKGRFMAVSSERIAEMHERLLISPRTAVS